MFIDKAAMNRRQFLQASLAATLVPTARAASAKAFSFVLLGDLHYDKPEHHDFAWVQEHSPDSVRQSANYSKLTNEVMPRLFATVRETIAERSQSPAPVSFVLQVGDLVEGVCGSEELAGTQNREAVEFIRSSALGVPFLFTKGNHDVTGPGSEEMFRRVFHPFLTEQARQLSPGAGEVKSGRHTVTVGNAQLVFSMPTMRRASRGSRASPRRGRRIIASSRFILRWCLTVREPRGISTTA